MSDTVSSIQENLKNLAESAWFLRLCKMDFNPETYLYFVYFHVQIQKEQKLTKKSRNFLWTFVLYWQVNIHVYITYFFHML